jgi:hypothetical protein
VSKKKAIFLCGLSGIIVAANIVVVRLSVVAAEKAAVGNSDLKAAQQRPRSLHNPLLCQRARQWKTCFAQLKLVS